MSVHDILARANEAAAAVFEERDYITTYGAASQKDPWGETDLYLCFNVTIFDHFLMFAVQCFSDDDAVDKESWVGKITETFLAELPIPDVSELVPR